MTDTPRTDRVARGISEIASPTVVDVEFARTLERELAQARGNHQACTRMRESLERKLDEAEAALRAAPVSEEQRQWPRDRSEQLLARYTELFPNYAWTDEQCAIDLLAAEIVTLRKEATPPVSEERERAADRLDAIVHSRWLDTRDADFMRQAARLLRAPQQQAEPGKWVSLTDDDRKSAFEAMPGGMDGFLKTWGWLPFAKEIERRCMEKNAAPQPTTSAEREPVDDSPTHGGRPMTLRECMEAEESVAQPTTSAERESQARNYVPKLAHLPGTELSPEVVLHRTLNKIEHIQAVAVVILWKNGESDADWSQMKLSDLCWVSRSLDEAVGAIVRREMPAIKEQA